MRHEIETMALHPWISAFLLFGPGRPAPIGERLSDLPAEAQREVRTFFRLGRPGWAALWHEHRTYLEAEGARLGIARRWSGKYFAEHLQAWEKAHS